MASVDGIFMIHQTIKISKTSHYCIQFGLVAKTLLRFKDKPFETEITH